MLTAYFARRLAEERGNRMDFNEMRDAMQISVDIVNARIKAVQNTERLMEIEKRFQEMIAKIYGTSVGAVILDLHPCKKSPIETCVWIAGSELCLFCSRNVSRVED